MFKFDLGVELKDIVTGFKGIVMARSEYYTGCVHYGLCPRKQAPGKIDGWGWFDETRMVFVSKGISLNPKKTSGPMPEPPNG